MDYMFNNASENKEDFVKKEDDVIYQITTSENQKNNSKNNISTLDLGDCEDTLRSIYNNNHFENRLLFTRYINTNNWI